MSANDMQWSSANPGLLIIMIDESGSMLMPYEGNESKTVFSAKAVNRMINNIIERNFDGDHPKNRCFLVCIGYNHEVREHCSGYLDELYNNPLRIEKVERKVPDGAGGLVSTTEEMPVWVEPTNKDGSTNMKGAFERTKAVVERWIADKPKNPAPVIINISDGCPYYDGKEFEECMRETLEVAQAIKKLETTDGHPLIFNARIEKDGKRLVFPTANDGLTGDEERFVFDLSSEVPVSYKAAAAKAQLPLKEGSRGCIFQADGVQLIQMIDFGSSKATSDKR